MLKTTTKEQYITKCFKCGLEYMRNHVEDEYIHKETCKSHKKLEKKFGPLPHNSEKIKSDGWHVFHRTSDDSDYIFQKAAAAEKVMFGHFVRSVKSHCSLTHPPKEEYYAMHLQANGIRIFGLVVYNYLVKKYGSSAGLKKGYSAIFEPDLLAKIEEGKLNMENAGMNWENIIKNM